MKQTLLFISAILAFASCNNKVQETWVEKDVEFVATVVDSKVVTNAGVNTWEVGDKISIFSASSSAEPGVSVSTNVIYKATASGASTSFIPNDAEVKVEAADIYYAAYPAATGYGSALSAKESIGFEAKAKGAAVDDYRYFPVSINATQSFTVDTDAWTATSNNANVFIAKANAPVNPEEAVSLSFSPVMPIMEIGVKGTAMIRQLTFAFNTNPAEYVESANFLTGKGVVNISNGTFTATNTSSTAYRKLVVVFKDAEGNNLDVQLKEDTPLRLQMMVGKVSITGGINVVAQRVVSGATSNKTIKGLFLPKGSDPSVDFFDTVTGKNKHLYQTLTID